MFLLPDVLDATLRDDRVASERVADFLLDVLDALDKIEFGASEPVELFASLKAVDSGSCAFYV